jgi:hypothetical protein
MSWDQVEKRKYAKNRTDPVTIEDLANAFSEHEQEEMKHMKELADSILVAFPGGIEEHREYHKAKMESAKAEKEFWDTAKKALITNSVSGALTLLKVILLLAALGLTAKFALPAWASSFITQVK